MEVNYDLFDAAINELKSMVERMNESHLRNVNRPEHFIRINFQCLTKR